MRNFFAGLALLSMTGVASAQAPGVSIYETYPTGRGYAAEEYYTPPVYGYYQQGEPAYVVPQAIAPPIDDCGEFHYWNGERCADARWSPPDVR